MSRFLIDCIDMARSYLEDIVDDMVRLVGVSRSEAIARVNAHWYGQAFLEEDDLIFHELPDFWALVIYFEDVPDWDPAADRSGWTPKPAPPRGSIFWTEV